MTRLDFFFSAMTLEAARLMEVLRSISCMKVLGSESLMDSWERLGTMTMRE